MAAAGKNKADCCFFICSRMHFNSKGQDCTKSNLAHIVCIRYSLPYRYLDCRKSHSLTGVSR